MARSHLVTLGTRGIQLNPGTDNIEACIASGNAEPGLVQPSLTLILQEGGVRIPEGLGQTRKVTQ